MFGPLAKWVAEVDQTERLPEYLSRAFHVAMSGRPGPVVLALPEDMLSAEADVPDLAPTAPVRQAVSDSDVAEIMQRLGRAERPLVVLGGAGWCAAAARNAQTFAESQRLPVAVGFRRQDYMDNRSPSYAGDLGVGANPALAKRLRDSDLLLVLGSRLGDIATGGYELIDPAAPGKTILSCASGPEPAGQRLPRRPCSDRPRAGYAGAPGAAAEGGRSGATGPAPPAPTTRPGSSRRKRRARSKLEQVTRWLSETLADDAILTNGAGNYAAFLHRYFRFRRFGTQLAPTSGSMGYGFPAAIAASLQHPDRTVVCYAGDGCFQMTLNEMSTAVQHGAKPIVIVVQQRPLRHDPDAPGTPLSGPGVGHRPGQSRLCRAGAGLWGSGRNRHGRGRVSGGVRAGPGVGHIGGDRAETG